MRIFRRIQLIIATRSIRKENLILVSAFGTNSRTLHGLIEFLGEFFVVHFIDLPGFINIEPPLEHISHKAYIDFVETKIKELNLENYFLGGISYGFLLANSVGFSKRCKGIIAIEPYIGFKTFYWSKHELDLLTGFASGVENLHIGEMVWHNPMFRMLLKLLSHLSFRSVDRIITEENPNAYFETMRQVFSFEKHIKLHQIPYILVINPEDATIRSDVVIEFFEKNTKKLFLIFSKIEHNPNEVTKDYVEKRINRQNIYRMLRYFH